MSDIHDVLRHFGKGPFERWATAVWQTGFGTGWQLIELFERGSVGRADPGPTAGTILNSAEAAGWIIRTKPQPSPSQRAFLGLSINKITPFYAEAYGWEPNRDSIGFRKFLGLYDVLGDRPYAELQREGFARHRAEAAGRAAASSPRAAKGPATARAPAKPKSRTFAVAQAEILAFLRSQGWAVESGLKVPHATSPDGQWRLYFKTQAVYFVRRQNGKFDAGEARSTWIEDIRKLDGPAFLRDVVRVLR